MTVIDDLLQPKVDADDPDEYDPEKLSRAVVAADGIGHGCLLWWIGLGLSIEHEAGLTALDDLGLDDAPHGISIWEGRYIYTRDNEPYVESYSAEAKGAFRAPDDLEWQEIRAGRAPWNVNDWRKR